MAKMTGMESITVSSKLLPDLTPDVQSGERLTITVDYGEHYRNCIVMDDLFKPLARTLNGLLSETATPAGWRHLVTSLYDAGSAAWVSAMKGTAERLDIRHVQLDYERGPTALWVLGTADLTGMAAPSSGIDCALVRGKAWASLDEALGLPSLIAPAPDAALEDPVVLRGMAYAGKRLSGQGHLARAAFDSAFTLDLERVYSMIAGLFAQEECTWGDFLEGWQGLFSEVVLRVQMCTGRYSVALLPSEAAHEEAVPLYARLLAACHKEAYPGCEQQVVGLHQEART